MLTVDPEKVQEMLPGGFFGAKRSRTRERFSKSGTGEKVVLPQPSPETLQVVDRAEGTAVVGVKGSVPANMPVSTDLLRWVIHRAPD